MKITQPEPGDESTFGGRKSDVERIDELLAANTAEVERRRKAETDIQVIYKALDAAEKAACRVVDGSYQHRCDCSSCIVIRGIRAFIEAKL